MADEALRATFAVVRALEEVGLAYCVGGSLASSLHGIPRSTQDSDLVVDLPPDRVPDLLEALGDRFYADEDRARLAVSRGSGFNVIHLETMFKVDLFVLGDDPLARSEMSRRTKHRIGEREEESLYVASAEDTVLQKLLWYRLGRNVSDRQWRDVIGVLQVQSDGIDREYLEQWAARLELVELLEEAVVEASGRKGGGE